jgi:phage terminase large subunit-like protein
MAFVSSAHNYEALRGKQCHWAWCDELAKWRYAQKAWDMLQMGLRLGRHVRCVVTTTPRPIPLVKQLLADPHTVLTRGSTYENLENMADNVKRQVLDKYENTRLGRQELYAAILEDTTGALWTHAAFDALRCEPPALHELVRVVVGVDPSGGDGDENDAQGIVAVGKLQDGTAVVLDDATVKLTPEGWGCATVEVAERWKADAAVAEVNFGGQMVEYVIRESAINTKKSLRVIQAHASRGKHVRAEPISGLYEQGRVKHAGMFSELEDELCNFTSQGYAGDGSPNRADALVWALTELMLDGGVASYDGMKKTRTTWRRTR